MSHGTRLALFIDGENISHRQFDAIEAILRDRGDTAVGRVYADWSKPSVANWLRVAEDRGLQPVQQTQTGKNSVDTAMIMDVMDVLHERTDIAVFCLVSSDSDFAPVCLRLKHRGKQVLGIGEAKRRASLANCCSEFIVLPRQGPKPAPGTGSTPPNPPPGPLADTPLARVRAIQAA